MHDAYDRFAIAWMPAPETLLSGFGCRWTGWCPEEARCEPSGRPVLPARSVPSAASTEPLATAP